MKAMEEHLPVVTQVRVVQLADNTGRLQAVFAASDLLDIAAITRVTKRRVNPVANFSVPSDILNRKDASTIIDKRLLQADIIAIRVSATGPYKEISAAALADFFAGPLNRFADICVTLDNIPQPTQDQVDDEQQMLKALGRFQSIRLKQRLEETLEFPPLPASSQKIVHLCSKQDAGTDELCDVISLDPSLSAQVVSWASSPYYGAPGEIESVEDAIIRVLGFDMVMNLALGLSMGNAFELPDNGPRHHTEYWFNSVLRACLMEALVKAMPAAKRPRLGHAYLAGLLHNFGYLAISYILPPHFSILSRYFEANAHLPAEPVEMHLLRFTKEQLGSWLLRQWGLPESICSAIRYAKAPHYKGDYAILAALLRACHQLVENEPLAPELLTKIGLTEAECNATYQKVLSASDNLKQMVSLIQAHSK